MPEKTEMKYCAYCRKQVPHILKLTVREQGGICVAPGAAQLAWAKYRALTQP